MPALPGRLAAPIGLRFRAGEGSENFGAIIVSWIINTVVDGASCVVQHEFLPRGEADGAGLRFAVLVLCAILGARSYLNAAL